MLVTGVDIRGQSRDTERIIVYARHLGSPDKGKLPLEILTDNIFYYNALFEDYRKISPWSMSKPLGREKALSEMLEIKSREEYKDIDMALIKKDTGNGIDYFLYAEGKVADLKMLPKNFEYNPRDPRISAVDQIRKQIGFPFAVLEKKNDIYIAGRQLTFPEFIALRAKGFDHERMFWEDDIHTKVLRNSREQKIAFIKTYDIIKNIDELEGIDDETLTREIIRYIDWSVKEGKSGFTEKTLTGQISEIKDGQNIIDYYQHLAGKDETIHQNLIVGDTMIRLHRTDDDKGVIIGMKNNFEQAMNDNNPLMILVGQNSMTYDLTKLREEKRSEKRSNKPIFTIYGQRPKTVSSAGFFNQVSIPGLFHVDLAPYSQNYFPFTKDNKFETIATLITGKSIEKKLDYDDLTRLSIELLLGREESTKELMEYGSEDSIVLNHIDRFIRPLIYHKCMLFGVNPDSVCTTSKKTLAMNVYSHEFLMRNHQQMRMEREAKNAYSDFNGHEAFIEYATGNPILPLNVKKDFSQAALFYIAPFTAIYSKILSKDDRISAIYRYLAESAKEDEAKNKDARQKMKNHQQVLKLFDLINTIEDGFLLPQIFFDNGKYNYVDKFGSIKTIVNYNCILETYTPMNASGNFYLFPEEYADNEDFKSKMQGLGFEIARGKALNIAKGSFILNDGLNIYKREIDAKGKLGFKTIYEQEIIHDIIENIFTDTDAAIERVGKFYADLKASDLDINRMIYFKKSMLKDFDKYSAPAHRQERIKACIEFAKKKGDELAYGKIIDKRYELKDFLELDRSMIFSEENMEAFKQAFKERVRKYYAPLARFYDVAPKQFDRQLESGRYTDILNQNMDLFAQT